MQEFPHIPNPDAQFFLIFSQVNEAYGAHHKYIFANTG
jgi:hypothetical protein